MRFGAEGVIVGPPIAMAMYNTPRAQCAPGQDSHCWISLCDHALIFCAGWAWSDGFNCAHDCVHTDGVTFKARAREIISRID